uniref:AT-hook motif nuclear-localized protein n=1 Tax=Anthurium amnicola TaxID=1678845 RepID=A0A1D1ZCA1_9ARAE
MDAREAFRTASSEHPAVMVGPNPYGGGVPPVVMPSSAGMMHGMRLSFNPMVPCMSKPTETSNSVCHAEESLGMRPVAGLSMAEPVKKKRGRPRKYGSEGSMSLALISPVSAASGYSSNPSSELPLPKRRGRPPGSGKKQQLDALGSAGIGFTPHIIIVKAGEDVASKIMAFSQQGPRTVCIISANGSICNATLRQPAIMGGTVTYEGRFEILSLSGSFLLTEDGGTRSRTGGLSVSLAGTDGRVLGGGVAGMLTAASPVQVVVASFIAEGRKPKPDPLKHEPMLAPPQVSGIGVVSTSPPSRGTSSDSSDNHLGSPLENPETCNSNQHVPSVPAYASASWPHPLNQHRHDGEMKIVHN